MSQDQAGKGIFIFIDTSSLFSAVIAVAVFALWGLIPVFVGKHLFDLNVYRTAWASGPHFILLLAAGHSIFIKNCILKPYKVAIAQDGVTFRSVFGFARFWPGETLRTAKLQLKEKGALLIIIRTNGKRYTLAVGKEFVERYGKAIENACQSIQGIASAI
jgi:hypothetical protein